MFAIEDTEWPPAASETTITEGNDEGEKEEGAQAARIIVRSASFFTLFGSMVFLPRGSRSPGMQSVGGKAEGTAPSGFRRAAAGTKGVAHASAIRTFTGGRFARALSDCLGGSYPGFPDNWSKARRPRIPKCLIPRRTPVFPLPGSFLCLALDSFEGKTPRRPPLIPRPQYGKMSFTDDERKTLWKESSYLFPAFPWPRSWT